MGALPGGTATLADIITGMAAEKAKAPLMQAQTAAAQAATEGEQTKTRLLQQAMRDNDIMQRAFVNVPTGDPHAISQYLIRNGMSAPGYMKYQAHLMDMQTKMVTLTEAQHKNEDWTQKQTGAALAASLGKPEMWPGTVQRLQQLHPGSQIPAEYPGDESVNAMIGMNNFAGTMLAQRKTAAETAASEQATATSKQTAATSAATEQKLKAELPGVEAESTLKKASADALKSMTEADWDAAIKGASGTDKFSQQRYERTKGAVDFLRRRGDLKGAQDAIKAARDEVAGIERSVATAQATAPIKINIATQTEQAKAMANATEDDYKRAGEQYAISGVMPPLGMGSAGRTKVEHYKQEWARENHLSPRDLVMMQAAFQGDKASLANFQKQRDQIKSFEQTAQKNLDLFLDAASKIPDTGVPWVNLPLRNVSEKMAGSANMAAVNAARQVANNEIAKVTSGGGLGTVLSDAARQEVKDYNPRDATFKQTLAVARILKQDMANRIGAMDATLSEIKGRIGGGRPAAAETTTTGKIRARDPQGTLHEAPAGTPLPAGWKLE